MKLQEIPTPALLLDLDRLEANLDSMAERTARLGVRLRPHIKTHKCLEIGRMQKQRGARGITASTLHEATIFAADHFEDITWAFPISLSRIPEARGLAERVTLRLVVDSLAAVVALERSGFPFHVWLKVDSGYHRAGVDPESSIAVNLARRLSDSATLKFDGLLSHSGHAYAAPIPAGVAAAAREERDVMVGLARYLRDHGIEVSALSVGSTPGVCQIDDLSGIDEARPGNYAFYDLTQTILGSCTVEDCALTLLASVISQAKDHSVVDAGALALSKDAGPSWHEPETFGEVFQGLTSSELDPDLRLLSLSQEHGITNRSLPVGTLVRILPNHSCLAVACFDEYVVVREDRVVDRWRIHRGRS